MATKLKIRMGHIEFEYDGDTAFDMDAIKDLFTHMESLLSAAPPGALDAPPAPAAPQPATEDFDLAIAAVAARLGGATAPELAIAAAAQLQICQNKASFTRKELLAAMQSATAYFKSSMTGNLSKTIAALTTAKRINPLNGDKMSLSAGELDALRAKLAQ